MYRLPMSSHVHVQHIHMIQQGDCGYRPSTTVQRARSGERLCLMTKQDIVNSVAKRALAATEHAGLCKERGHASDCGYRLRKPQIHCLHMSRHSHVQHTYPHNIIGRLRLQARHDSVKRVIRQATVSTDQAGHRKEYSQESACGYKPSRTV